MGKCILSGVKSTNFRGWLRWVRFFKCCEAQHWVHWFEPIRESWVRCSNRRSALGFVFSIWLPAAGFVFSNPAVRASAGSKVAYTRWVRFFVFNGRGGGIRNAAAPQFFDIRILPARHAGRPIRGRRTARLPPASTHALQSRHVARVFRLRAFLAMSPASGVSFLAGGPTHPAGTVS